MSDVFDEKSNQFDLSRKEMKSPSIERLKLRAGMTDQLPFGNGACFFLLLFFPFFSFPWHNYAGNSSLTTEIAMVKKRRQ